MRYAKAKRIERARDQTYQYYLTDALKVIAENTQKINGGRSLKSRYAELVAPKKPKPEESGKQIANDLISKLAGTK